jgi:phage-related protein
MTGSKPLVWLHGEVKTPPFSRPARIQAGFLLRRLQNGEILEMPASRPMPTIGSNCHELRIDDGGVTWRIVYHVDSDAIVILEVFQKKSRTTPRQVIEVTRKRLRAYQRAIQEH